MIDAERAETNSLQEVQKQIPTTVGSTQSPSQTLAEAEPPIDKKTLFRLIAAGYSFFCAGINDGSLGVIIPYLLRSYDISTNFVSIW